MEIINLALDLSDKGEWENEELDNKEYNLRDAAEKPTNRWLRNVRTYLDAQKNSTLHQLKTKDIRESTRVNMDQVVASTVREFEAKDYGIEQEEVQWGAPEVMEGEEEDHEEEA